MDNLFYSEFKKIIRECGYTNTYKMAWAKALVEISLEKKFNDREVVILLEDMAQKFLTYYWNQTIFFDLIQGSNLAKPPLIVQYIKILIEEYYHLVNNRNPIRFEKIEEFIKSQLFSSYQSCILKIVTVLKRDVSWRFTFLEGKQHNNIYYYKKGNNQLTILGKNLTILRENHQDLFDLINYKWGLIIESFDSSPRINKKIKIIDRTKNTKNFTHQI